MLILVVPVLVEHRPPFGIDGQLWNALEERTSELVALLGGGGRVPPAPLPRDDTG